MRNKLGRALLLVTATVLVAGYVAMPAGAAHAASKPKCFGKTATIVGKGNGATINGTKHDDVIVGTKGNDVINGKGGNDLICGLGGTDTINGGPGNDKISGKGSKTGDGSPFCLGKVGALIGGPGNDTIIGSDGNDCIYGNAGNDTLSGGNGDDELFPGTGTDKVDGGSNGNPLQGTGLGDTVSFIDSPACVVANLTTGKATSPCGASNGLSGKARAGAAVASATTMTNVENLFGSQFNDTLVGNANGGATPNGLEGWLGNDTLNGGGGLIEIAAYLLSPAAVTVTSGVPGTTPSPGSSSGGEGNDTLVNITGIAGSNFDDTLTGQNPNGGNILIGGGGADNITGSSGNDTILGDGVAPGPADGNDTINAGDGNDTVSGGGGNDTMDGGKGTDTGDGGPGTDTCTNFETVQNCEA